VFHEIEYPFQDIDIIPAREREREREREKEKQTETKRLFRGRDRHRFIDCITNYDCITKYEHLQTILLQLFDISSQEISTFFNVVKQKHH